MRIVEFFKLLVTQFVTAFDVESEVSDELLLELNEENLSQESRRLC